MDYIIRLENFPPTPTAVVRRRADKRDLPRLIPESCGLVWNTMRSQQIKGAGRHIALYLDNQINLEVGVELDSPFPGHAEVVPSSLPAGPVAATTHLGPYPQLHRAHEAIRDWCKSHNHTPAGPQWEIYGHWQDSWNNDPSQIRTDVYWLLKPTP